MSWLAQHVSDRSRLNNVAAGQDDDTGRDAFYHGEIMRDEQHGEPETLLEIAEQPQELQLDRHV